MILRNMLDKTKNLKQSMGLFLLMWMAIVLFTSAHPVLGAHGAGTGGAGSSGTGGDQTSHTGQNFLAPAPPPVFGNEKYVLVAQLGKESPNDTRGTFLFPHGVTVDQDGTIYVADSANHRIRVLDQNGKLIREWGRPGSKAGGELLNPLGIAIDHRGLIYVADSGNSRIQVFTREGVFRHMWNGSDTPAGRLLIPLGLTVTPDGIVYVADTDNHRIGKFDNLGKFLGVWGGKGNNPGEFLRPFGVVVDQDG